MGIVHRVLDRETVATLDDYATLGGGTALDLTRKVGADAVIELIGDAGLRGRGGAGFPTGVKWRTIADARSEVVPTTVAVNAAEGEPGTFKDRALLRTNPYRVLEGAAIAALAVGSDAIRIGIKATFDREIQRLVDAIEEATGAGWFEGIDVGLVLGPSSYLFGEETALLEVIEGRQPFPRVTPPFRRGVEVGDTRSAAGVELVTPDGTGEAPALVDNVETLAHVPLIVTNGASWFRELGTEQSPGSIVCTVSGATRREGVAELAMGTTLRQAIDLIGWGASDRHRVANVLSGTANPIIPAGLLDTPLTYEAMRDAGSGLGSAGFIVFDETTSPVAIARGVSRFLAVESCGQCEPCKDDGLELSRILGELQASTATEHDLAELERRVHTVSIGARCNLARQQEDVVGSLLGLYDEVVVSHVMADVAAAAPPVPDAPPIVPIADLVGGRAILDVDQLDKQPDWSYDEIDSGTPPAELLGDTPVHITTPISPRRRVGAGAEAVASDRAAPVHELVDEAHELLDRLLVAALHADPEDRDDAAGKLAHLARVHVDAVRRVLHPMARRYGAADTDEMTDLTEERDDLIRSLANLVDNVELSDGEHVATLHALGQELRRHCEEEERLVRILEDSMDDRDREALASGLAEARATSLAA